MSDEELASRTYKELLQLDKGQTSFQKWVKNLDRHVSKEDLKKVNKHRAECSTSLAIREMQMKTRRYNFTPTRMAVIKKTTLTNVGENSTLIH